MGGNPDVREIDESLIVIHYDLPVPRRKNESNGTLRRLYSKWRTWYDYSCEKLRSLGYPIGYSVIIANSEALPEVLKVSELIKEKYRRLKFYDNDGILPPESKIRIGIVKFKPASKEDYKILEEMFREYLKESLETIKDYIIKKLKEERKDPKEVNLKVREMLKRLKRQDRFGLLERDAELKKLLDLIDVLTVEV